MQRSKSKFSTTAWQWIMLIEIELNWLELNSNYIFIVHVKRGEKKREREREQKNSGALRPNGTTHFRWNPIEDKEEMLKMPTTIKKTTNKQTWIYACCTFPWIDEQFQRQQMRFCPFYREVMIASSKYQNTLAYQKYMNWNAIQWVTTKEKFEQSISIKIKNCSSIKSNIYTINYKLNAKCIKNWLSHLAN